MYKLKNFVTKLCFSIIEKNFFHYFIFDKANAYMTMPLNIEMELHLAIHQQLVELGWIK